MSVLSLYIPIVSENVSETFIKKMFKDNDIGIVMRVDFVKNIEKNRREAFIHFDEWFNNEKSNIIKEDIKNPETKTRFIYNEKSGKYWPLHVNRNAHKRVNNPKYAIISKEEVETSFKNSLNMINSNNGNNKSNSNKKAKTYADVASTSPTTVSCSLK